MTKQTILASITTVISLTLVTVIQASPASAGPGGDEVIEIIVEEAPQIDLPPLQTTTTQGPTIITFYPIQTTTTQGPTILTIVPFPTTTTQGPTIQTVVPIPAPTTTEAPNPTTTALPPAPTTAAAPTATPAVVATSPPETTQATEDESSTLQANQDSEQVAQLVPVSQNSQQNSNLIKLMIALVTVAILAGLGAGLLFAKS